MIEKLIEILNGINEDTVAVNVRTGEDGCDYVECDEAEDLIYDLLIADGGFCNWENIDILKRHGFNVYPGDQDSFGWLVGCIETKKGIIMYG